MAKLKDLAIKGAGDRLLFDLDMIHEKPGYNARNMESPETQAHIRKMADAIKENGTDAFPEITVFQEDDKIYVHRGHCRFRAHKLAKAEGAPVVGIRGIAAPKQNEAEHVLDLLNSNDGLPLTPLEQAAAVERLTKFEWTPEMIAQKRGVSVTTIKNLLKLLEAPEEVKQMVRNGEVSARTATDVIGKEGAATGTEMLKKAVQTAKASGKEKATPKHLPKNNGDGSTAPPPVHQKPAAPEAKNDAKPAAATTNYEVWGPRMRLLLQRIRDVENISGLQSIQVQIGPFLKEMDSKPGGA